MADRSPVVNIGGVTYALKSFPHETEGEECAGMVLNVYHFSRFRAVDDLNLLEETIPGVLPTREERQLDVRASHGMWVGVFPARSTSMRLPPSLEFLLSGPRSDTPDSRILRVVCPLLRADAALEYYVLVKDSQSAMKKLCIAVKVPEKEVFFFTKYCGGHSSGTATLSSPCEELIRSELQKNRNYLAEPNPNLQNMQDSILRNGELLAADLGWNTFPSLRNIIFNKGPVSEGQEIEALRQQAASLTVKLHNAKQHIQASSIEFKKIEHDLKDRLIEEREEKEAYQKLADDLESERRALISDQREEDEIIRAAMDKLRHRKRKWSAIEF